MHLFPFITKNVSILDLDLHLYRPMHIEYLHRLPTSSAVFHAFLTKCMCPVSNVELLSLIFRGF